MSEKLPNELKKYNELVTFDELINLLDELKNNTNLTPKQEGFIKYRCDHFFNRNKANFSLDEIKKLNQYELIREKNPKMFELYASGCLTHAVVSKKILNDDVFEFVLNNVKNTHKDLSSYLFLMKEKKEIKQFKIFAEKDFEFFFNFIEKTKYIDIPELMNIVKEKIKPLNVLYKSYLFDDQYLETILDSLLSGDEITIKHILKVIREVPEHLENKIISSFNKIKNKDIELIDLITRKYPKNKGFDTLNIVNSIDTGDNYVMDLANTINRMDYHSEDRVDSKNYICREIHLNKSQYLLLKYDDIHEGLPDFYNLLKDDLLKPIIEKINNIEYEKDLFEFMFHNTDYSDLFFNFKDCLSNLNDKQHLFIANMLIKSIINGTKNLNTIEDFLIKIPPEKNNIYSDTLSFFYKNDKDLQGYESNEIKERIKHAEMILLQKKLDSCVPKSNAEIIKTKI